MNSPGQQALPEDSECHTEEDASTDTSYLLYYTPADSESYCLNVTGSAEFDPYEAEMLADNSSPTFTEDNMQSNLDNLVCPFSAAYASLASIEGPR